jgi:ParB-like nuclease domain
VAEGTALRIEHVPVQSLNPHSKNPRRGNVELIKDSLQRFGQVRPIVVGKDDQIIAGNHTYRAIQELGWETVAIVRPELSEEEALAYLVADNRTSDVATNDDNALVAILEELQAGIGLEGTGYTPDDVDDITAALDRVEETEVQMFEGDYAESPEVTAARWEGREEGKHREVVFLLETEKYEDFREKVKLLKKKYGTDSMAEAVYIAVVSEARQLEVPGTEREPSYPDGPDAGTA